MPMIDLARTPRKDDDPPESKYPWGMMLYVNHEVLDKLGLTADDFKVGTDMDLKIRVRVTGLSSREYEDGMQESVDLQVTGIDVPGASEDDKAKRLFGGD